MSEDQQQREPAVDLNVISTRWSDLREPARFALRYAGAIRQYLLALVRDPHDADEIAQEFLMRVSRTGFGRASPDRGRFRHYLIAAVRNAARAWQAKQSGKATAPLPEQLADTHAQSDDHWDREWMRCLLDRALAALEAHQARTPGNLFHTLVLLSGDDPNLSARDLAERVREATGRALTPEAIRQQQSRARRHLARLIIDEVAGTIDEASPQDVAEELAAVGLMKYVKPYLGKGE